MNLREVLNDNQIKAVEHGAGPCIVLAGPGSGKTRVISHRIANLVNTFKINPASILAITFTKASAMEMKERSLKQSIEACNKISFGTFHSIFFKILRNFKNYNMDNVLDEKNKRIVFKNILKNLDIENGEDDDFITSILTELSLVKNELMDPREFESSLVSREEFIKINEMLDKYKLEMRKIDFDDMLVKTYELLRDNETALNIVRNKYKYILVDEFQDINKVQFEILKMIAKPNENIFIVGDEDQSIYGFRGARPDFIGEFENHFNNTRKIVLDINYRSTDNIINAANKLIVNNKNRHDKTLKGVKGSSEELEFIISEDSEDEAKKIGEIIAKKVASRAYSYTDFAIIYRTNIQARALIDVFLDMNLPFSVRDGVISIYDHWVAKDILAYLRAAENIDSKNDFERIINKPFRYISKENIKIAKDGNKDFLSNLINDCNMNSWQIKQLRDLEIDFKYLRGMTTKNAVSFIRTSLEYDRYIMEYCQKRKIKEQGLFEILNEIEGSSTNFKTITEYLAHIDKVKEGIADSKVYKNNGITLTTIHSSKGLEFKEVFIVGAINGVIPHEKSEEERDTEEERRLFYVAMTRSQEKLYISSPKVKYGKKSFKSDFIDEICKITKVEMGNFEKGDKIYHKKFADGEILEKDEDVIKIKFSSGVKILNYFTCLKNNLIKKI